MLEITLNQMADAFARALATDYATIKKSLFHDFERGVFDALRAKPKPAIFSGETAAALLLAYAAFPEGDRPTRRAAVLEFLAARTPAGGEWELRGADRSALAGLSVDARGIAHAIPRALAGEEVTLRVTDRACDAEGVSITRAAWTFGAVPAPAIPAGVAAALDSMPGWRVLRTVTVPAGELIRLALAEIAGTDA